MKQIILLGSRHAGEKNDVSLMLEELSANLGANIAIKTVYFEDILFRISSQNQQVIDTVSGYDLKDAELIIAVNWYKNGADIIYRDIAFATALYLRRHKVNFWNSEMAQQRSISKLSTMMQLGLSGIDIPDTLFAFSSDVLISQKLSYPLIIKDVAASRGRNNHLIKDVSALKGLLTKTGHNRYMAQEYITNDHDLRVICFGGAPAMIAKRTRKNSGTHLNNVSRGANAELVSVESYPKKEVLETCVFICKLMGRELAGIDILPAADGSGRLVFLEVNAIPQLTSGAFVQEKMKHLAQSLTKDMR